MNTHDSVPHAHHRAPLRAGAFLIAAVLAGVCLGTAPADAALITLTTSGTIDSGTDTSGAFGQAGISLAGQAYTLVLSYDGLGSYSYASASSATTSGPIAGDVRVTVGRASFASRFVDSYGALLTQTSSSIYGSNVGDDGTGEALSATNAIFAAGSVFPVDLGRAVSYSAQAADAGLNVGQVSFTADNSFGGSGPAFTFTATPSAVSLVVQSVPEPASLVLLSGAIGALGLMCLRRPVTTPQGA